MLTLPADELSWEEVARDETDLGGGLPTGTGSAMRSPVDTIQVGPSRLACGNRPARRARMIVSLLQPTSSEAWRWVTSWWSRSDSPAAERWRPPLWLAPLTGSPPS